MTPTRPNIDRGRLCEDRHKKGLVISKQTLIRAILMGVRDTLNPILMGQTSTNTPPPLPHDDIIVKRVDDEASNAALDTNTTTEPNTSGIPKAIAEDTTYIARLVAPNFQGTPRENPITFMRQLRTYIGGARQREEGITLALECMAPTVHSILEKFRHRWNTYEDLETEFLGIYWNTERQEKVRQRIINGKWYQRRNIPMLVYFARKLDMARGLTDVIAEPRLVNTLMQQFPEAVQIQWLQVTGAFCREGSTSFERLRRSRELKMHGDRN